MKIEEISITNLVRLSDIKETAIAIVNGDYEDPNNQADAVLKNLITEYAKKSRQKVYDAAAASGDPMQYLCKAYHYPTISVKESEDEGKSIQDSFRAINLLHAHEKISGGIGSSKNWDHLAGDLTDDMTLREALRIGDGEFIATLAANPDNQHMQKVAKEIADGKNPLSNNSLYATLEKVIQAMIGGDFHISKYDRNYMCDTFAKAGRSARIVTTANYRGFSTTLMVICNRILTGETHYVIDSKNTKRR